MDVLEDLKRKLAAAEARAEAAEARVLVLEKQVAELLEKLNRNAYNSNKPPSTESPADRLRRRALERERAKKRKSDEKKKARGGQPGHEGAQRALVPVEEVDDIIDHYPDECGNCWRALTSVEDPDAKRAQTCRVHKDSATHRS